VSDQRAIVLGAGGVVGTAWMAGLGAGLRAQGVDLAGADLIVGTSAGAIIGAMLATGQALDTFASPPVRAEGPAVDGTAAERAHLARVEALITAREWPENRLLITAVDAETGRRQVWDHASGVLLAPAVASSIAFPGASPPITVGGRRYLDGGLWSATNADLAAGARTLVVVEPLAHLFPREPLRAELAAVAADTVTMISPDPAAIDAFGPDLCDRAAWQPAYQAGVRQAAEHAGHLHANWHDADHRGG